MDRLGLNVFGDNHVARRLYERVEADLVSRGVRRVGLGVPGGNAGALRLAERLGFALMSQQMAKKLPAR